MRQIGHISNHAHAHVFGEFLVAHGIRNEIERENDGLWMIWIRDEDQVAEAQAHLARFAANPNSSEFRTVAVTAEAVRQTEAEDLEKYRRRVRTRKSLFPAMGGYGVGILTYSLIVMCIVVSILSNWGQDVEFLRGWFIADPFGSSGVFPGDVLKGEFWRVLTPIFVHFRGEAGFPLHLLFNMIWLYQLGCMIEARCGSFFLGTFIVVTGVFSNLAQITFSPSSPLFGGMSGVVYALAGYVWIRGKYDRGSGLYLDPQTVMILMIWLVVCFTGYVGSIANGAHVAGLLAGMLWGRVQSYGASRGPG